MVTREQKNNFVKGTFVNFTVFLDACNLRSTPWHVVKNLGCYLNKGKSQNNVIRSCLLCGHISDFIAYGYNDPFIIYYWFSECFVKNKY